MFSTAWPETAERPELIADAVYAYEILRGVLRRVHGNSPEAQDLVELDALHAWSMVHGMAGVMSGQFIEHLGLKSGVIKQMVSHSMSRHAMAVRGRC
jgi:hypothetical protein